MENRYNREKWGELPLKFLVIESQEFIVFIDNDLYIDWKTSDFYDQNRHGDSSAHNSILSKVANLECKPNYLPDNIALNFKRLLGESLARSFASDYESANCALVDAEKYLEDRGRELSRRWYLLSAGQTTLIITLIGILSWIFRDFFIGIIGQTAFICFLSLMCGSMGALLSIIMRMGDENFDIYAGEEFHKMESRYRIFAGMLSALLAALAIKSGVILSGFLNPEHLNSSIVLIGLLAGMSERFAPSMMAKLNNDS